MPNAEIVKPEAPSAIEPASPMESLLRLAIESKADVGALERLFALKEKDDASKAAAMFFDSMAEFQRLCPPIKKTSTASFATKNGGKASYTYAELDEIARTVNPILGRLGLSYTWDSTVTDGMMVCTCTVRHKAGHSVTAKFGSKVEGSSLMSGHQATAATLTYARRQSLVQALGLCTTDDDIDGKDVRTTGVETPYPNGPSNTITEEQVANLRAMLTEIGPDEEAKFLAYAKLARLGEMRAEAYPRAVKVIEGKRNGASK